MEAPVKKNEEYIVDIIDNGFEGEGIAKIENFTIFIPAALKGERIKVHIVKVLSSHAFGKIIQILEPSNERVLEDCATYARCGGCGLRHINYEQTLVMKQNIVQNLVNKMLMNKIEVKDTIGMGNPYHYRNKAQYPLGVDEKGNPTMGIYAKRTHTIIPMEHCYIQTEISEEIARYILEYMKQNNVPVYNEKTRTGFLRHIVIKVGFQTKEIMCVLVLNQNKLKDEKQEADFLQKLLEKFPNIRTVVKNINKENTNVILGKENVNLYGNGYIFDVLGDYIFKISPLSFYQVNPVQTEVLYHTAIELAELKEGSNDILFDLYCGIGTIGIFASAYAKKVYGIEIVKQAIEDAKENAKMNQVDNIEFIAGDVEEALTNLIEDGKVIPDVVFIDPPRKGLDEKTIENLLKIKPKKIAYISCNPATLVRDLAKLEECYGIKQIQPVDMFPFTNHVECCSVLSLRNTIQ